MTNEKTCWNCGHFAFACFVTGEYHQVDDVNDVCDKWCQEGTKGTITDYGSENEGDGTTWAENEWLKDDMSNL
ncbi:MAG TPA: hypothetical protein H9983_14860 [Candidatus Kurthia intestinigallinarum]|nr:hypothetical protein [Candidatus Kurthia intestinigallinarum]